MTPLSFYADNLLLSCGQWNQFNMSYAMDKWGYDDGVKHRKGNVV